MSGAAWLGLLLTLPAVLYAGVFARYRRAWGRLRLGQPLDAAQPLPAAGLQASVIIAARNEASALPALLADLGRQTWLGAAPPFEVIVVDDHSTDATADVVRAATVGSPFPLRLLTLAALPGQPTGKKAAVEAALAVAQAPWVICTDADCRVSEGWLARYAPYFAAPGVQLVSGPVLLTGRGLLAELQGLELAALVATGAASIAQAAPTMCNGANLAYRRAAFAEVGGFRGNDHLPSGDDEFLLHKLAARYPQGIRFVHSPDATVRTAAQPTLGALLQQRVRWASKWRHYQPGGASRGLALLVLGANVSLYLLALLLVAQPAAWPWAAAGWALKLGADAWFLTPVLGFFGRRRWLRLVPLLQLLYPPYALAVGLLGLRGGYRWKGRQVRA
ncbi:glycosyltransferase [Hymenobacter sp. 15J16-1T3B]|uniref:glycosyltransferase n=1 Tax=Hymenobacter sp. 15J16-1T3B TaxID=2886941 RepID=UPI001D11393D|nr:glycosyltransferase [Hymenobacter sp. 15J16-1T3B]MCC3159640.1 glycosyltransferase [Hymenobacter sp. 15J16-1T3B]